jgi:hypothetical protein
MGYIEEQKNDWSRLPTENIKKAIAINKIDKKFTTRLFHFNIPIEHTNISCDK